MKNIIKTVVLSCGILLPTLHTSSYAETPVREHRSIWMTPYLGHWPSSSITPGNANNHKNILTNRLDKFREQNVNVLYYHCRGYCDATYESSYEPWSSYVSGTRGATPAFDPFGFLIEEAHARGIEVYAWINPYRYCGKTNYGQNGGELNYENSHPEWLIRQSTESILNPGLEEVKQRIVDIITEIVTKYDVDGVVFDDYFYTSNTPMSADEDLYKKYTAGGGTMSQADWRRANVNDMVSRVNKAIKSIKPYVTFGISPAGVASPPNVTSEYGLPAAPGGGDWQYNGIYSDPLAWYKAGTIDFMSPQIYWPERFESLSEWWINAGNKYNRHCYPSVDISNLSTYRYAEFANEIEATRRFSPSGTSGLVFFSYKQFVDYHQIVDGKSYEFGALLGQDVYNAKALTPLRPWSKSEAPQMVENVKLEAGKLSWDSNEAGRYAIYKAPKNQTSFNLSLDGISYSENYTLPENGDDFNWYVAAYDRFGNVSSPLGVGASKQSGTAPRLVYPATGEKPVDLFEFKWEHESNMNSYTVEVAEDSEFSTVIGLIDTDEKKASVSKLPTLTNGKTYYWRVKSADINVEHPVSEISSFIAPRIEIISPTQGSDITTTGTISWSAAVEGASYLIEISRVAEMNKPVVSETVKSTSFVIPAKTLTTGTKYYARVTAMLDEATSISDIKDFNTENKDDYEAPKFVNPSASGVTLHSDDKIRIEDWDGMTSIRIEVAATESFPSRTSYIVSLTDWQTETSELGKMTISSKNLEDGATYYLRARGSYNLTTGSSLQSKNTEYSPVYTFKYSAEAGVSDLTIDSDLSWLENAVLHVGKKTLTVTVYNMAGMGVATFTECEGETIDLSYLTPGIYLIKAGAQILKMVR